MIKMKPLHQYSIINLNFYRIDLFLTFTGRNNLNSLRESLNFYGNDLFKTSAEMINLNLYGNDD